MTTDTSERGLETLICDWLTGARDDGQAADGIRERPPAYSVGWILGDSRDYEREYCVDLAKLSVFLHDTQPEVAASLDLGQDSPTRVRSWPASRARSPSVAPLKFCGMALSTGSTT